MRIYDIPIFDSLTHPTLDGSWINSRWDGQNSFPQVVDSLKKAYVRWAWAVSKMENCSSDPKFFIEACLTSEIKFFPMAFMNVSVFKSLTEVKIWLSNCRKVGFLGVKLHPRISRFDLQHRLLPGIISEANQLELTPFLCTYFYSSDPVCRSLTLESLFDLLYKIPDERLVLLHGGTTRLLELAEMTRHFKQVLLDLSWTMCEFSNSSLELDLRYVMDRCKDRVCIGSDSPEISPISMRLRFEQLTHGFSQEYREKIAFRNMFAFTGLPCEL